MPCSLATLSTAVVLHSHGTLVVLVHDVVINSVTLRLHEVLRPQVLWHQVVCADQLRLCGALFIEFLLG